MLVEFIEFNAAVWHVITSLSNDISIDDIVRYFDLLQISYLRRDAILMRASFNFMSHIYASFDASFFYAIDATPLKLINSRRSPSVFSMMWGFSMISDADDGVSASKIHTKYCGA